MAIVWTRTPVVEEIGDDETVFEETRGVVISIIISAGLVYPDPPPLPPNEIFIEAGIVDPTSFPFSFTTTKNSISITADTLETGAIFNQGYIEYSLPSDLSTIIKTTTDINDVPDNVIMLEYYSDRRTNVSFFFDVYVDVKDTDTFDVIRTTRTYSIKMTNNWTIDANALGFLMLNKDGSGAPEL